jgi:hypothetical protein
MARAYAMAAGDEPSADEDSEHEAQVPNIPASFAASFRRPGEDVPSSVGADFHPSPLGGEDDEWVSFVRAQLVRLFPDFHDAEGQATMVDDEPEAEEEEGEPSFRSELLAMRTEIGVLRGIVAELSNEEEPEPVPEAPATFELDPTAMGLAIAVVRALDASHSGLRADADVFAHDNLRSLLATVGMPAFALPSAPASRPDTAPPAAPGSPPAPAPLSPQVAPSPLPAPVLLAAPLSTPPDPSPHAAHAHLDAHEEIEKARDVAITPEVGTPPHARAKRCEADEMCDEELDEVKELAGEAQMIVS